MTKNFSGIMMGGLNSMAPSRSKDIQGIINRALIGGILSCMLRASIAGILYKPTNEFFYGTHTESFGCLIDGNKTDDYNPYGCDLRCIEKYENQGRGRTVQDRLQKYTARSGPFLPDKGKL